MWASFVILLFVYAAQCQCHALQIVFSNSSYESTAKCCLQIFKDDTDWCCAFSCSICNQNGHFIGYTQNSNFPGYDSVHKSWEDITSYEEQKSKTKTKWKGSPTWKRTVSKNHRTAAAKVTAELNIRLKALFPQKTVRRELHKSNIHSRAAIAKPVMWKQR